MWLGVSEEERRVNNGSMLYHAICERRKPLDSEVLSLLSPNMEGTLDSTHEVGVETSSFVVLFSKSSIYEALSCVPLLCPAKSFANSPVNDMAEGCVR